MSSYEGLARSIAYAEEASLDVSASSLTYKDLPTTPPPVADSNILVQTTSIIRCEYYVVTFE